MQAAFGFDDEIVADGVEVAAADEWAVKKPVDDVAVNCIAAVAVVLFFQ